MSSKKKKRVQTQARPIDAIREMIEDLNLQISDLTEICKKITVKKLSMSKIKKTSINDIPYFITDNSKLTRAYGWKPKKNITNIIKDTYKWLKINKSNLIKYF